MTGTYPPDQTWAERTNDPHRTPTRLAAAWNILRGRPTIYRCQVTSGTTTTHLGPIPGHGPLYAAQNIFNCEGAYIDANGVTLERLGTPGARHVIDGR